MPFIEWKPEYSVCHPALDHDHRILVSLINQLHEAIEEGQPARAVGRTLTSLRRYVETHFAREESILAACGYPDLEAHAEGHRALEATVEDIEALHARAPEEVDAAEVLEFLRRWLVDHILRADMRYAPLVSAAAPPQETQPRRTAL